MTRSVGLLVAGLLVTACSVTSPTPPAPSWSTMQPSAAPWTILLTSETPVVPGWCLQPVAWAIEHLPTGHVPVASVTIMPINLCPSASPCVGPPHRGELWAAFTMRDGSRLGMWVVNMMGIAHVQSAEADGTPPPSVNR